jgi:hypothetical protein
VRSKFKQNLQRLSALIGALAAQRVVFLGDMLHSRVALPGYTSWRDRV